MPALDSIKSDDTSDVVFDEGPAIEGEDAVARFQGFRHEGGEYVNVPGGKGFSKPDSGKPSTRRLTRRQLKASGSGEASKPDPVEISDEIEDSEEQGVEASKQELVLVDKKAKRRVKGLLWLNLR